VLINKSNAKNAMPICNSGLENLVHRKITFILQKVYSKDACHSHAGNSVSNIFINT
jgi:hypothetical protein